MATKPKPDNSFDAHRVMLAPEWRQRNHVSKSEWYRRRQRQRAGEPGSENLLPRTVRLSPKREGITFEEEARWQAANQVTFAPPPSKRRHERTSA
jgi:hypothetical protein